MSGTWAREELQVLLDLVLDEIRRNRAASDLDKAALDHLYGKLKKAIESAPGMMAS